VCALVMALVGFSRQQISIAKIFLLLLLLAIILSLWNGYVAISGGQLSHLSVGFLWGYFSWGLGPLLFLYVTAMTQTARKMPTWYHFLVPFIVSCATLIIKSNNAQIPKFAEMALFYALYLQIFCYGVISTHLLRNHAKSTLQIFAADRKQSLSWLYYLCTAYFLMWVVDMLTTSLNLVGKGPGLDVYQYYLLVESILVIAMAIFAIKQPQILYPMIAAAQIDNGKYHTSQFEEKVSCQLKAQLDTIMEERQPVLDSELNLQILADMLQISSHELSQLLNQTYGVNFYDFVNRARVDITRKMLRDDKFNHQTIIDIALGAGFTNKTTFNRAFKKYTGETPSVFRRNPA